ncbi:phosphorylated adapter RNA export protein isoform X1 [Latimeria chalumnae]|uniref:phosphorylated adapter RNA export protein isoform X1 n=1 Tax=Latimeria chalumnae TaxID=7897 RepID=UPI00313AD1F4
MMYPGHPPPRCPPPVASLCARLKQKPPDAVLSARPFQTRSDASAPLSNTFYRNALRVDSSDDSSMDSEDEERVLWKRKRQKCFHPPPPPPVKQQHRPMGQSAERLKGASGNKMNNVWGTVLQEQNQDAVATELGILGMEGNIDMSRQAETYNYILARKMMEKEREQDKTEEMGKLDKDLDEYMQGGNKQEENEHLNLKRKRPVRERLGERLEMDYKGRYELTAEDSEEKVADEIAYRLREPKQDLILRVVNSIGKKKAIELLVETAEVEQNGGLFVMNGSRRRTPGGVYLNLLKHTPSITQEQTKEIFYVENQKEFVSKKAAKKRRRQLLGNKMKEAIKSLNLQEHDDASRETFASDTNEALASLDDPHESRAELKMEAEDGIEVDNCAELETF